jgi:hypothetical protein
MTLLETEHLLLGVQEKVIGPVLAGAVAAKSVKDSPTLPPLVTLVKTTV